MKIECAIPEHIAALQVLLGRCETSALRKGLIIAAHCHGVIDQDETTLLIQAWGLETA